MVAQSTKKKSAPPNHPVAPIQFLEAVDCYFLTTGAGAKKSANAFPFGVPKPVTLSQPILVLSDESVPKVMISHSKSKALL
jgi:hypothetical protein